MGYQGAGVSAAAPMAEHPGNFNFPSDISPIPGNFSGAELTAYLGALGAYLRQGPRLTNLRDTETI